MSEAGVDVIDVRREQGCGSVVSVVVRVRNAARDLRRCLTRLRSQFLPAGASLEIVVVDNESTDGSVEVGLRFGATVVSITTEQFTWGRALNRGIKETRGDIVLLLSADAYPADQDWVLEMLAPFSDPSVAAVYGRQLPRPDAPVDEYVRLANTFGPVSQQFSLLTCTPSPTGSGMLVSNACAAIRKFVWERLHYDEEIRGGEEGVWTYYVLKAGHSAVYWASARVFHSHRDRVFRHAYRQWELLQKNLALSGRHNGVRVVAKVLAAACKRRCCACVHADVPLRTRLEGTVRLPFELLAFAVLAVLEKLGVGCNRLRFLIWG